MGGCVASKLEGGVVTICRERKRQLKLAMEKRYALAEAHYKYGHALLAVAAAVDFFVAGYSSPPKPYLPLHLSLPLVRSRTNVTREVFESSGRRLKVDGPTDVK